jgi:hypothetical protein
MSVGGRLQEIGKPKQDVLSLQALLSGKYPPAEPGALGFEPLKAAVRGRSGGPVRERARPAQLFNGNASSNRKLAVDIWNDGK